jgi:hypothetical protein
LRRCCAVRNDCGGAHHQVQDKQEDVVHRFAFRMTCSFVARPRPTSVVIPDGKAKRMRIDAGRRLLLG